VTGYVNYFGVSGNFRSLLLVVEEVKRVWSGAHESGPPAVRS
jgi:hypothetical protein